MPKILITGNGFDLHHSLPTTYSDFMNIIEYLIKNKKDEYNFNEIYQNVSNYTGIIENFKEFEYDDDKIIKLQILGHKNLLYRFFQNEYKLETWIDFESKIELIINSIVLGIELIRDNIFKVAKYPLSGTVTTNYKSLNNNVLIPDIFCFFEILNKTASHGTFIINDKFLLKRNDYYIDIDSHKIFSQLFSQLMEFKVIFNLYLLTFVKPLINKAKNKDTFTNFFNSIDYHYTFNYTNTFEKLLYNNTVKTEYLHGRCDEENENIVFGINDVNFNDAFYSEYLKFTKYYQKLNGNTDYYFLNTIGNISHYEKLIFIFWGHSLDQSDSSYINEVFDLITESKSDVKKIIIIYHNESTRSRMILNLLNIRGRQDIETKMRAKDLVFHTLYSQEINNIINLSTSSFPITNLL